ncbi:MAG: NPCBM/NEW2 domain-containing protein [Candidatus Kryptoniota bacterium]
MTKKMRGYCLTVVLFAVVFAILPSSVFAGGTGLAQTPPMGWNSWNKFACNINEALIEQIADSMAADGMKDAGYQYIIIDDCWLAMSRDGTGRLEADPTRFPDGIKVLADYVHSLGLKLGIYEDRGSATCQNYPGSYGHEAIDAQTFASWGVDYLKYDNCNPVGTLQSDYTNMHNALDTCGRPIVFSICSWSFPGPWVVNIGNLWRTTGDISDNWGSMVSNMNINAGLSQYAGPGHWNDPDMLEVGNGGMTTSEYQTHFTMWAEMAAPLIAGNDLRSMSPDIKAILENQEVIGVDQDSLGIQGTPIWLEGGLEIWSRLLKDSSRAVVLLNTNTTDATMSVSWNQIGITRDTALVRDLWKHVSSLYVNKFFANVPGHGAVMLKISSGGNYDTLSVGTSAPTKPVILSATALTPNDQAKLTWSLSSDSVGVAGYQVYGNGALMTTTPDTSITLFDLIWNTHYVFTIEALNQFGNVSAFSDTIGVGIGNPQNRAYVSDLNWLSAISGQGTVQRNQNVDSYPLTIGGVVYAEGLGTHSVSQIIFLLNKKWDQFISHVGVDQEVDTLGSVTFSVYADGVKMYDSGLMTGSSQPKLVNISVTGVDTLTLDVGDGGDGTSNDDADWGYAQVISSGTGVTTGSDNMLTSFRLEASYPDPFNPSTTIGYDLPERSVVTLEVYDVLGRSVKTLVSSATEAAGSHSIIWNADNQSSGVYICHITVAQADGKRYAQANKMVLLK